MFRPMSASMRRFPTWPGGMRAARKGHPGGLGQASKGPNDLKHARHRKRWSADSIASRIPPGQVLRGPAGSGNEVVDKIEPLCNKRS